MKLKEEVEKNRSTLYVIIFDEAHHGATTNEDRSTPYSKLASTWNSEDFPNVFVLLVSATPWNLLSVKSKIPEKLVYMDPKNDYEISEAVPNLKDRKQFNLHTIQWSDSYESDLKIGKTCRLMVMKYYQSISKYLVTTYSHGK